MMIAGDKDQPSTRAHVEPPSSNVRVVIEAVSPTVDDGRFPAKGSVDEPLLVEADVFADGQDLVAVEIRYELPGVDSALDPDQWPAVAMAALTNDRWRGGLWPIKTGMARFQIVGWIDRFGSWQRSTTAKVAAGQNVAMEMKIGAGLMDAAAKRASASKSKSGRTDGSELAVCRRRADDGDVTLLNDITLGARMARWAERGPEAKSAIYEVWIDRQRARFSAWYELFPRSTSPLPDVHGTLRDCADQLDYIAAMGFDVVYLPPIHPIGFTQRKGKNNAKTALPTDVGSPWAIGSAQGGHCAIHPELGDFDSFDHLVGRAQHLGMEIALDLAFQCSPDHPWVHDHPSWFRWRPDGSVQFAENPPKRYEDIYPLDFDSEDWRELWTGLLDVVRFWLEHGVRIFRVDNPHTKPFAMWEWIIDQVRTIYPEVIFLAEAFTRPKVMKRLAKAGFTQSYTYFTWRTSSWELRQYLEELTAPDSRAFFRPNFWPNTPDILAEPLQHANLPTFMSRIVLATTLTANYGIYGPAFELMENVPRPGSEEYLDNEKYELRHWDRARPDSLAPFITELNRIRRENIALQTDSTLTFHETDNAALLCYSKTNPRADESEGKEPVLVVVNLDPWSTQSGFVHLNLDVLGLRADARFQAHDLLTESRYPWVGATNYVELDPWKCPAHIFRLRTLSRTERDLDYYV
jgi:starch synthase (maltosyl-transferring)